MLNNNGQGLAVVVGAVQIRVLHRHQILPVIQKMTKQLGITIS